MRVGIAIGAALIWPGLAAAAPVALSPQVAFYERYEPAAQITGVPVVGLLVLGASSAAATPLSADLPGTWAGSEICARLVSSDGRYEARGQYTVAPDWTGGRAELSYPTGFDAEVKKLRPEDVAALVSLGSCEVEPGRLALAGWKSQQDGDVVLLVNSFRADETYLVFPLSGEDVDCTRLDATQRTAFDVRCPIPAHLLLPGGTLAVELNRVRHGAIAPAELLAIDTSR